MVELYRTDSVQCDTVSKRIMAKVEHLSALNSWLAWCSGFHHVTSRPRHQVF